MHRLIFSGFLVVFISACCTSMRGVPSGAAPAAAPPVTASPSPAIPAPTIEPGTITPSPPAPPAQSASQPAPPTPRPASSKPAAPHAPTAPASAATAAKPKPPAAASAGQKAAAATSASAAQPTLNLADLEQRLRDTKAIGVFTKLSLKNQVDDLLNEFRDVYKGPNRQPPARLRQHYDLLLLKVLSLLQDSDPPLAAAISSSREAIWSILADPEKFAKI